MKSGGAFELKSDYTPAGDQPSAIEAMVTGLRQGLAHQTLLGVTGSGKTFSIANVVAEVNRPTLVMAPNKTLAQPRDHGLDGAGLIPRRGVIAIELEGAAAFHCLCLTAWGSPPW